MMIKKSNSTGAILAAALSLVPICGFSQAPDPVNAQINEALKKAAKFLVAQQDPKTGAIHENLKNEVAMTSLAVLALAAMGHQPADPSPEGRAMMRGLEFVLRPENQKPDGYLGGTDGSRMYGHGITTLMLAEMLGMGADSKQDALIRERCRKAVDLILRAQRVPKDEANRGGWRYSPNAGDSDMSITCWQTMALRAAKNAGMDVPKEAIDLAVRYIKSLYDPGKKQGLPSSGAGFGYSGRGRELSTTAEGLLALQVCGDYDSDEVKTTAARLLAEGIKPSDRWFFYTGYYYAQGMYQSGGKFAVTGKKLIAERMLPLQSFHGWWESSQAEERQGGKIYATSLAVLALGVKNHYLPIFQR